MPGGEPVRGESGRLVGSLDAHQHFWDPDRVALPWMTDAHAAIAMPFLPDDLHPEIAAAGVDGTVLVQSACSNEDTDLMLELADVHGWIRGVVAWVDLRRLEEAEARLDELRGHPKVCGIRHLIHDEPDPHWILRPEVRDSLALVEEHGLVLELPAVWPRHLGDVPVLAEQFPSLRIVVDHLGKPPLDGGLDEWSSALRTAAAYPHVQAKFSGVHPSVLGRALEVALEAFGPERLIWGSDWPVCLLTTTYAGYHAASVQAVERLAPSHAHDLFGGNAARTYGLEALADYAGGGAHGTH